MKKRYLTPLITEYEIEETKHLLAGSGEEIITNDPQDPNNAMGRFFGDFDWDEEE